jgi:hypothetical protein
MALENKLRKVRLGLTLMVMGCNAETRDVAIKPVPARSAEVLMVVLLCLMRLNERWLIEDARLDN